jgi:ribose transport system ATP-binding protein
MVEITKVFNSKLSVLILDEPTASLTNKETAKLFNLIEKAKNRGVGIIYISHRINEIKRIADRVTVLRDGKYVDTLDASKLDIDENHLVELMTGRVIDQVFPKIKFMPSDPILTVENLTTANGMVNQVSFEICAGEIIGMAGLVSSGKSRALRACFGVEEIKEGKITFNGEEIRKPNPKSMLKKGMFYVPSDRKMEGLFMNRSMKENISIASLPLPPFSRWKMILNKKGENSLVDSLVQKLNLKPFQVNHMVGHLSGGNQQKVLLARVLSRDIKLFVFDEPTVGVDIGTRVIIYDFIKELCEAGAAVVIISSDLSEILHLTNRTYVFYQGYKTAELKGDQIEEKNVLQNFFKRGAA